MSTPTLDDYRLHHRLRVRWAEIDLQRIVFNPHYLMYVDSAFTDYWRALAVPYEQIPATLGGDLYVKKSTLEFFDSAHLDDLLQVGLRCQRIGNSSLQFVSGIFRDGQLLVSGELIYVFADPATQTSRPVPPELRALFEAFEGGATMHQVEIGTWDNLGGEAGALRREFLQPELGVGGLDQDATDARCEQLLLRNRLGLPIATGRLAHAGPGCARIERMAVIRTLRGSGWGRCALEALAQRARERGDTRLVLCAHAAALPFYQRLGFSPVGQPRIEAGLTLTEMTRTA